MIWAAEEGGNRRRQTGGDGSMTERGCWFPPTSGSTTAADVTGVAGGFSIGDVGRAPGITVGAAGDGGNDVRGARVDEDESTHGTA
jgi:hypothetical protein